MHGMDVGGDFFVLGIHRPSPEKPLVHYFTNHRGENILWAFTSLEEARKFVEVRVDEHQAYLDLLEDQGPDPPKELAEGKEFSGTFKLSFGRLFEMAVRMGIDYIAFDPGSEYPNSRLMRVL
jgi:hypothetical protein